MWFKIIVRAFALAEHCEPPIAVLTMLILAEFNWIEKDPD